MGLASLRDPALVTETIAQTLGAADGLAEHIGEREMLLLLDNLEQVIDAAPDARGLARACPNLALLVTSRERLRVRGEVEYAVPPLASWRRSSSSATARGSTSDDDDRALCARLDDLPLAIELAAARTKSLTPAQILERLSQRLDLLKGGRDADPRQQTLRATIEWSYDLLDAEEQRLFARLSVFAGDARWRPPRRSWTPTSTRCSPSSRRASCASRTSATGCSRRSASSRPSGSTSGRARKRCAGVTPSTSCDLAPDARVHAGDGRGRATQR